MDKDRHTGHGEWPFCRTDSEVMPDIQHQHGLLWHQGVPKAKGFLTWVCMILMLVLPIIPGLPGLALADSTPVRGYGEARGQTDPNGYDIAFIIDNREIAGSRSALEDVKALSDLLDRHMLADHIVRLERPSFQVICDIFGGCPSEAGHVWPSLIAQITDRDQSRLFVYYLGPARIEGLERQWLFRDDTGKTSKRTSAYAVGWLHKQMEKTGPKSALLMMETSFAPRPLPCISENPLLIDATMKTVRRNYAALMRGSTLPEGFAELSATWPVQAPHCDRFELTSEGTERPLFTKYVLKGIVEGEADKDPFGNENGIVTLGELADYANDRIERAVQFQWGRQQAVWKVGPQSRSLARVEPRDPVQEVMTIDRPAKKVETSKTYCERNPRAAGCHVCERNPTSGACRTFCQQQPDSFHCAVTCTDREISDACPCTADDPRAGCAIGWCQWSAEELGPSAVGLLDVLGIQRRTACARAGKEARNAEPNVFWQIFTPIIWRLARPYVEPWVACTLRCEGAPPPAQKRGVDPGSKEPKELPKTEKSGQARTVLTTSVQTAGVERSSAAQPRTAFHLEICDEFHDPLPPYIGIPRWMPGTLMISETLRSDWGCEPMVIKSTGGLKRRPHFTGGMPPPVWTYPQRFAMPPPVPVPPLVVFGMPPPVTLEPGTIPHFKPSVSQIRWLQSALTLRNFSPGPLDGTIGPETRAAIERWRRAKSAGNVIGRLTKAEFEEIVIEFGNLFDQVHPNAPLY